MAVDLSRLLNDPYYNLTDIAPTELLDSSKEYEPTGDFFTFKINNTAKASTMVLDMFFDLYGQSLSDAHGNNLVYGDVKAYYEYLITNLAKPMSIFPYIVLSTNIHNNFKHYGKVIIKPLEKVTEIDNNGNPILRGWIDYACEFNVVEETLEVCLYYLFKYGVEILKERFREDEKEFNFKFDIDEEYFSIAVSDYLSEIVHMSEIYNLFLDVITDYLSACNNEKVFITGYYKDKNSDTLNLILEK